MASASTASALRAVVLALAVALLLVPTAARGAVLDDLRSGDVAFGPGATWPPSDTRARLEAAAASLRKQGFPTKFVVIAAPREDQDAYAGALRARTGGKSLLVLAPRRLGIAALVLQRERAQAFQDSLPTLRRDPIAGTIEVANRLAAFDRAGALPPGAQSQDSGGGVPGWLIGLLVVVGLGGIAAFVVARRSAGRGRKRQVADQRAALEPMVDALAARIADVEEDIGSSANADAAGPHHDEAIAAYGEVRDALPTAASLTEVAALRSRLESGLRSAAAARAALDGAPEPPLDAPLLEGLCAFDPKHGRAVTEADVRTPAGDVVRLPVCGRCADGLARGEAPEPRTVARGGEQVPYWRGSGLGGTLAPAIGGVLLGTLLADSLTPDAAAASDAQPGQAGDGDHGGGGDFGDADAGGNGDFGGGGDFGGDMGGDFGGGGDF
jgi:uncharacterized membrane protein YgcG